MSDKIPATPAIPGAAPTAASNAESIATLTAQVASLIGMLRPVAAPTGQPAPLPQVAVPPPLVMPIVQPQFQPPLLPLNSPAGASPSLQSLFPDIEPACITAVITHDLKASDLYKLGMRVKDSEPTYSLSATAATVYFYRYLMHIATLATEYEWPAVFEYHTLFFNRRCNDMLAGEYDGWGSSDIGLLSSHVYPHWKAISATPAKATSKRPATTVISQQLGHARNLSILLIQCH
ncbi:hypothetical protein B0H16DRAFT_1476853 [Mycena metata]|uniref:Uncharacterized protein n=1 Tax=Mycena metata TaxID=1033252 RepID=A0AAD7MGU7_9AGAR|nr:hypothetical protein B0H16DRAFT_1476853 [Mycena metata]